MAQTILTIDTNGPGLTEFTRECADIVRSANVDTGLLTIFIRHTSASLTIQENADPDVQRDLLASLEQMQEEEDPYQPLRTPTMSESATNPIARTFFNIVEIIPRARSNTASHALEEHTSQPRAERYSHGGHLPSPTSSIASFEAAKSMSGLSQTGDALTRLGQISTLATVSEQNSTRGELSKIQGHLVEFPLEFLCDEILKPAILPRDIHI